MLPNRRLPGLEIRGYPYKKKPHYERVLWLILVMTIVAWLSGCSSLPNRGYFSVAEFDSREADQLTAAAYMDTAIYSGATPTETRERSFTAWAALFEMIAKLKVRVRVLTIQWDKGELSPSLVKVGGK